MEREHLLPLADEGIPLVQTSFPAVNGLGCAKGAHEHLFGPVASGPGHRCKPRRTPARWNYGPTAGVSPVTSAVTAVSSRSWTWNIILDVLYRKPGALAGSKPLEQRRQAGLWPPSFDRLWEALIERHGKQSGTRQMIELLKLSQRPS